MRIRTTACLLVTSMICLFGQTSSHAEEIPVKPASFGEPIQSPTLGIAESPDYYLLFETSFLFWTRDNDIDGAMPIVAGPDATSFSTFDHNYETGIRFQAALMGQEGYGVGFSWTSIGSWDNRRAGQLANGVSFDTGVNFGNPWAGDNAINANTYFSPIFQAATFTDPGGAPNELDEFEGFGPNTAFPGDANPTFDMVYSSQLKDLEFNLLGTNETRKVTFGMGYRRVSLNEFAQVRLRGTFRAANVLVANNNGLSHEALTDPNGGALTHLSGAADGYDDETTAMGPDVLQFLNRTQTNNTLNGVNAMANLQIVDADYVYIDGFLKAGVYHNHVRGSISEIYSPLLNDDSIYGRTMTDSKHSVAFVGNIGLNAVVRLTTYLNFIAGYEVMFLSGVALAPEQQAAVIGNNYRINADGSTVVHGGKLGLELTY